MDRHINRGGGSASAGRMSPRVRFAPSPTGYLHVGAARTALYNYLFARHAGGTFILRSDDTDRARGTDEFQEDITAQLRWLGLDWDEGIMVGGPHGTYRQSDRYDRYRRVVRDLIKCGHAYYSFVTPGQLAAFKKAAREAGTSPAYDGSLEPSADEVAERIAVGEPAVVRFRVPRPGMAEFSDVVRGDMRFNHSQVDDFIILRSNNTPTYHLASTVDDVDYGITHIIRGEDLLSSAPKHILLTQAMGADPAIYAHLALLMGPDGRKLSKRHGDTAVAAYRKAGYLPEALNNYLAVVGWNTGEHAGTLSLDEMIDRFDLPTVSKSPGEFDTKKLMWMNGVHFREMEDTTFAVRTIPVVEQAIGRTLTPDEQTTYTAIVPLIRERTKLLSDVGPQVRFLFTAIDAYAEDAWEKALATREGVDALDGAHSALKDLGPWTTGSIEAALRAMLKARHLSTRKGLQPIRAAVTGVLVSPPLFESLELLGRDETLTRIENARAAVGSIAGTA